MTAIKELPSPSAVKTVAQDQFYHVGLLPADREVLLPAMLNPSDRQMTMVGYDAWTLYSSPESVKGLGPGLRMFAAKARQYCGLTTSECHFPSMAQFVEYGEADTSRTAYPGTAVRMSHEKLNRVVKSCYRYAVRYPWGLASADDPTSPTEIIDFAFGTKDPTFTDEQWALYKVHHATPAPFTFNPQTDRYFAEFVYVKPMDVSLDPSEVKDYAKNPNRFHSQWIGPVRKSFFLDPPKSVAQFYPREA